MRLKTVVFVYRNLSFFMFFVFVCWLVQKFGLDLEAFRKLAGNCPEALLQLANDCCAVSASGCIEEDN